MQGLLLSSKFLKALTENTKDNPDKFQRVLTHGHVAAPTPKQKTNSVSLKSKKHGFFADFSQQVKARKGQEAFKESLSFGG